VLLAALALALGLCPRHASAAAFDVNDPTWEGCTQLLGLAQRDLGEDRVLVRSVLDWAEVQPTDGILILHPMRTVDYEEATAFMRAGGRLAVVDDYGLGDQLLEHFQIQRRTLPARPMAALRGKPALPLAEPASEVGADNRVTGLHPTVLQVDRVVLNHATGFNHPRLTPVLIVRGVGEPDVAVAVAGQVDAGRLFAVGDPSAFMNQMLRYPGNRAFALGLMRYLVEGDRPVHGTGRLFIYANQFDERGGFGGVTPWRKSIDRALQSLRDSFGDLRRQGLPPWLRTVFAVLAALALAWSGRKLLGRSYRARDPRFARPTPLVAQGGIAGHAAVLSSPSSPVALALLELRSALCEALAQHLDMSAQSTATALVDEAHRRGQLDDQARRDVLGVLGRMQRAEAGVLSGRPARVKRADLVRASKVVREIFSRAGIELHTPPGMRARMHHFQG